MATILVWKKTMLSALAVITVACATVPAVSAAGEPQEKLAPAQRAAILNEKDIEAFADTFFNRPDIQALGVPGALFVVVKDGKVLLQKGYGYADLEAGKPVDPEQSRFRIASVSKVITATAVMQLVEQGKIDLEQDVQQYMGDVLLKNNTGSPLTMEHLLTHTTGFDIVDPPPGDMITGDLSAVTQLKDYIIKTMPTVIHKPGEVYKYDNFASMLQGYIVEQVSGKPFHQYVNDNIFKPLGMKNSQFVLTPGMESSLATGYNERQEPLPSYNTIPTDMPQGSMLTTGSDMAKFMLAHLNEGTLGETRILRKETVKEMQSVQKAIHPKVPTMTYGFEFAMHHKFNDQYVIGKGGSIPGFASWMWLLPEQKVGAFIVYNNNSDLRDRLFEAFMDRYFPAERQPIYATPAKDQLERYEGIYRDLRVAYLTTRIKAQDGVLLLEDLMGKHTLQQVEPLLFEDEQGSPVAFQENKDGSIRFLFTKTNPAAWSEKLPVPERFKDVGEDHPYASYIDGLHQLNVVQAGQDGRFLPDAPMTRAEFAIWLVNWLGAVPSKSQPAFRDTANRSDAGKITTAFDMGVVTGVDKGSFEPDRPITRQEAAAMASRLAILLGHPLEKAKLTGKTDSWAVDAVSNIVGYKFYGPEVTPSPDGSVDYRSKQVMTRKEAAALLYLLGTKSLTLPGSA